MFKRSICDLGLMIVITFLNCGYALTQTNEKTFELGGQFSLLRLLTHTTTVATLPCLGPLPCPVNITVAKGRETEPGFGGRFGYNFSRYLSVEGEGNFFPRDRQFEGGRKTQVVFGLKVGKRFNRVGLFGKARPGMIRYGKGDLRPVGGCTAIFPPPITCFQSVGRTNFAFDAGGVIDLYPSEHSVIRFDAGDTIIRFGQRNVVAVEVPPGGTLVPTRLVVVPQAAQTTHNFQGSIGLGFRF